ASVDAEDVVQETLITLWQLYGQDYPIQNPEPLAVKILKTKCVAEYRKKKLDTRPIYGIEQEGGPSASSLLDREDVAAMEQTLMSHLTQTQQDLIKMRGLQGLSLDEIAEVTGKPKTSVKSTISAARKTMLDLIKKMQYD
ncbi:MAG: RNA polymerase sigma factor, partial [Bacteroidales bacterium]|nr:RNA polymerase sigma factor [Bacteroidales bacterium]